MDILMKFFGAIGLVCITYGIFSKEEKRQDAIFIIGGSGLLVYSIYLKDPIFIPLQIIFIAASLFEIFQIKKKKNKK